MATRAISARVRSRLCRSSLVGKAGANVRARSPCAGDDGLEAVSTSALQTFYSSDDVAGSAQSASESLRWRLLQQTLCGMSNYNLSYSVLGRIAAAPEFPRSPGATAIRQQHSDDWLLQRASADADRRRKAARSRTRLIRRMDNEDGVVPSVSSQREHSALPATSEEEALAGVLGRPDLIITRNVEWANLAFGFEQQNKYVIMDPREPQAPVGYILEDSNVLMRQFLRRRRPFLAQVLDAYGNEICIVRRPIWLINSTIFVEVNGKVVGSAHRRWHLWRRVYDCYLGARQFAAVENPGFWYWTFTLHDQNMGTLAVIDRNWRGFGFEFLTDAGQYVVRFGDTSSSYTPPQPSLADARLAGRPILSGSPTASNEMHQLQAAAEEAEGLDVVRPLSLSERAVVLALAVSLDNDYFSNHGGGFGFIPLPFFGGSEEVASSAHENARNSESPEGSSANDADDPWAEDRSSEGDADVLADFFDDQGSDGW